MSESYSRIHADGIGRPSRITIALAAHQAMGAPERVSCFWEGDVLVVHNDPNGEFFVRNRAASRGQTDYSVTCGKILVQRQTFSGPVHAEIQEDTYRIFVKQALSHEEYQQRKYAHKRSFLPAKKTETTKLESERNTRRFQDVDLIRTFALFCLALGRTPTQQDFIEREFRNVPSDATFRKRYGTLRQVKILAGPMLNQLRSEGMTARKAAAELNATPVKHFQPGFNQIRLHVEAELLQMVERHAAAENVSISEFIVGLLKKLPSRVHQKRGYALEDQFERFMQFLRDHPEGGTASGLAQELGIHRGSIYRYVRRAEKLGLQIKDGEVFRLSNKE